MQIEIPDKLKEFCLACPHPVYVVGGYVRNRLCGLPPSDIDICGAVDVQDITHGLADFTVINKSLGTAEIKYKGERFEYTRLRREVYKDGSGAHTPLSVGFVDDILSDALRRDFAAGSVYYDIKNDKLIDPVGGLADIKNKILRSCDPARIFASDGLRLMRLCRLAAELGFDIHPDTFNAARANCGKLADIAAERKRDELDKILGADQKYGVKDAHYHGLILLWELGLLPYVLPSLSHMEIPQNPKYHSHNVLQHTFLAVKYAPPDVRLAALMHDTGKPVCQSRDGNMYNHAADSYQIVMRELGQNGLKYPARVVSETARLVRAHMYDCARNTGEGKMLIFVAENLDIIDKLSALAAADRMAAGRTDFIPPRFLQFKQQLIDSGAPLNLRDLAVDGTDLQNAGITGKQIAGTLKNLWHKCIQNPRLNSRDWLLANLN